MQHGDLDAWERPRLVVVIEGVLCIREEHRTKRRLRRDEVRYDNQWLDLPLKRTAVMKRRFPDYALDLITFEDDEFLEDAVRFLDMIQMPYDTVTRWNMGTFRQMLRYQTEIKVIYDSDPIRLDQYGQLGQSVVLGGDY